MTNTATNVTASAPVALITAGAAGIGRVMAEAFINQGCRVHVCDIDPRWPTFLNKMGLPH